ncbi:MULTISPECIES: TraR/DksA family transcriptional regulator [Crateriforma]|uniref:RNA polymerase-binding transcription factor DksA n=1 Tax=Crateriforma conspicua TaxID=2527996 RepID=A0A5C6FPH0_9PLAN|nr:MULTISPECIES: TraR/DksA family transcriptional regulator [Crateriforma]TWU63299.1 RNA polymerase-binding transcription factor DksA [Crateriforma conspicua]
MSRKESLNKLRVTLVRRRDALRRALDGDLSLLQELHGQKTGDPLDAAADTIQDELNSQLVENESRELGAMEDAIARFEAGTYGNCESCGKPIPITRLRAVPYATDCIDCRRREEDGQDGSNVVAWNRVFDVSEVDPV